MLEITLQTSLYLNTPPKLSHRIRQRIPRLSGLLHEEGKVLRNLLQPFPYVMALPDRPHNQHKKTNRPTAESTSTNPSHDKNGNHHFVRNSQQNRTSSPYDTTQQIVPRIVRDWMHMGAPIRESLYGWAAAQLEIYHHRRHVISNQQQYRQPQMSIPGAGLGRLSYNLAREGYSIEANELSISMVSVAYQIFKQGCNRNTPIALYPFLMDYFVNKVDSEDRYETVISENLKKGPTEVFLTQWVPSRKSTASFRPPQLCPSRGPMVFPWSHFPLRSCLLALVTKFIG